MGSTFRLCLPASPEGRGARELEQELPRLPADERIARDHGGSPDVGAVAGRQPVAAGHSRPET
jgi:hypothetical protein